MYQKLSNIYPYLSFTGGGPGVGELGEQPLGAVARGRRLGARPAAVQRVDERGGLRGRRLREEEGTPPHTAGWMRCLGPVSGSILGLSVFCFSSHPKAKPINIQGGIVKVIQNWCFKFR